jgi:SAM-dependent methyltransferase
VAYVVQNRQYQEVAEPRAGADWQVERVASWQTLYNETYSQVPGHDDPTFNIIGWESSYTGLPIPAEEMREQVEGTSERLRAIHPSRVLEIGCGTGLLLFRLAPYCSSYVGTDFSPVALTYIQEQLRGERLPHVRLLQRTAENFQDIEAGVFDAVVLNSVVQYFPGIEYLVQVLEEAIRAVAPGGYIFVGDVRSLPLLEAFHTAVELHQADATMPTRTLRERAHRRMRQEQELVIDPAFFLALQQHLPQIRQVAIQPKRGWYHNELTRFRYDVLLQVGGEVANLQEPQLLDWSHVADVAALRQLLLESTPDVLGLTGVPNARLQGEVQTVALLAQPDGPQTVGQLRDALDTVREPAVEPESLWALGEELPYEVHLRWAGVGAEGQYDVLFQRRVKGERLGVVGGWAPEAHRRLPWSAYANDPRQGDVAQKLAPALRGFLQAQLPEYMVPSTFVLLEALPLTPNGKVDRQALPAPDHSRAAIGGSFVAPQTELERLIATVWQEVLGLEKVGVHDNFFDLGGHSLLLVRLQSKLRDVLHTEVAIIDLLRYPTVSALAKALSTEVGASLAFEDMRERVEKQRAAMSRRRPGLAGRIAGDTAT